MVLVSVSFNMLQWKYIQAQGPLGVKYSAILNLVDSKQFLSCPMDISGEGNGNPLQYSCLENPMDGGAW